MTPERLAEIREAVSYGTCDYEAELIEYIDQLIGERDRARDLAIRAGAFD